MLAIGEVNHFEGYSILRAPRRSCAERGSRHAQRNAQAALNVSVFHSCNDLERAIPRAHSWKGSGKRAADGDGEVERPRTRWFFIAEENGKKQKVKSEWRSHGSAAPAPGNDDDDGDAGLLSCRTLPECFKQPHERRGVELLQGLVGFNGRKTRTSRLGQRDPRCSFS